MANRSLRNSSPFFRHAITISKVHHKPLLYSPSVLNLQYTRTNDISNFLPYSQPVGTVSRNIYGALNSVAGSAHPHLSVRTLVAAASLRSAETVSKQSTEPPPGEAEQEYSSSSDSSDDSNGEGGEGFDSVDSIRLAVLDASLDFVLEHGWSEKAIAAGAETLGYSSMAHGLVEGGGGELFIHLQRRLNDKLEAELQRMCREGEEQPDRALSKAVFIEEALKYRLSLLVPYLSVWSRGLVVAAMTPSTALQGLHNIATLADLVCHYAGDTSIGTDWYTKRAAVVAVYKAAELSLLQDQSTNYEDTWQFLQRRVSEMVSLESNLRNLDGVAAEASNVARAALRTGLNMIGLNTKSR